MLTSVSEKESHWKVLGRFVIIYIHFHGTSLANLRTDRMWTRAGRLFKKSKKEMLRFWAKVVTVGMTGSGWLWDGFGRQKWRCLLKHCMWGVKEQVKEGPKVLACTAGEAELAPCGIGTIREGKEIMIRSSVWEMFLLRHLLTMGCWVILFSFLCHSELRPPGSQLC